MTNLNLKQAECRLERKLIELERMWAEDKHAIMLNMLKKGVE